MNKTALRIGIALLGIVDAALLLSVASRIALLLTIVRLLS
jgi:hypothetical protein